MFLAKFFNWFDCTLTERSRSVSPGVMPLINNNLKNSKDSDKFIRLLHESCHLQLLLFASNELHKLQESARSHILLNSAKLANEMQ